MNTFICTVCGKEKSEYYRAWVTDGNSPRIKTTMCTKCYDERNKENNNAKV